MSSQIKMEPDPDGLTQQVAVIMTGKVYRDAGLKHSKHPKVEGLLYDTLCQIGKHRLRDDVRKMALSIATSVRDKEFQPTVAWLDNFMRRFCLSKKKMGFHSVAMLKAKISAKPNQTAAAVVEKGVTQEEVFSALGFPKDFTGFSENLEQGLENGKASGTENGISDEGSTVLANGSDGNSSAKDPVPVSDDSSETVSQKETVDSQKETVDSQRKSKDSPSENTSNDSSANDFEGVDDTVCMQQAEKENANNNKNNEEEDSLAVENNEGEDPDPMAMEEGTSEAKEEEEGDAKEENSSNNDDEVKNDTAEVVENEESNGNTAGDSEKMEVDPENESSNGDGEDNNGDENTSNGSGNDENSGSDEGGSDKDDDDDDKDESGEDKKKSKIEEDEDSIEYTKEENKYYKKNIEALQKRLNASVVRCTSCFEQVNHQLRNLVHTHPVLGIFICKRCRKYYGKGRFCKDEDGYDEYCRLCAEGGDLLCCEQKGCFNGFCKRCIKRAIGRTELRNAEKSKNWACYVCDKTALIELRALHRAILNNLKEEEKKESSLSRKELKEKEIKSKFSVLKKNRLEKAQKNSPENKSNSKEDPTKASKNKSNAKAEPWLRDIIDSFTDMLKHCLNNVEKIDGVWCKYDFSKDLTGKTGARILKQLAGMEKNFGMMKEDVSKQLEKMNFNSSVEQKDDDQGSTAEGKNSDDVNHETERANSIGNGEPENSTEDNGDQGKSSKKSLGDKEKDSESNVSNEAKESEDEDGNNSKDEEQEPKSQNGKGSKPGISSENEDVSSEVEDNIMQVEETDSPKKSDNSNTKKSKENSKKKSESHKNQNGIDVSGEESDGEGGKKKKINDERRKEKKVDENGEEKKIDENGKEKKVSGKNGKEKKNDGENGENDKVDGNGVEKEVSEDGDDENGEEKEGDKSDESSEKKEPEGKKRGRPRKNSNESVKKDESKSKKQRGRPKKSSVDSEGSQESEDKGQELDVKLKRASGEDEGDDDDSCSLGMDNDSQDSSKAPNQSANSSEGSDGDVETSQDFGNAFDGDRNEENEVEGGKESNRKSKRISGRKTSKNGDEGKEKKSKSDGMENEEKEKKSKSDGLENKEKEKKSKSDGVENEEKEKKLKSDDDTEKSTIDENMSASDEESTANENKSNKINKIDKDIKDEKSSSCKSLKLSAEKQKFIKEENESNEDEGDEKIKKEKVKEEDNTKGKKDIKKVKTEDDKPADEVKKSKSVESKDDKAKKKKKTEKQGKDDSGKKRKDNNTGGEKKSSSSKSSRKRRLDDSDDSLLGIGSDESDDDQESAEENTDEEIKRRREDHTKVAKKKRRKRNQDGDSENEELKDEQQEKKAEGSKVNKKGKNDLNKKNKEALSSLLVSESEQDSDDDESDKDQNAKPEKKGKKKSIDLKTVVSETSDSDEIFSSKKKKKKNEKGKKPANDNEKAKDALLESETASEIEFEDKPKPKCKKKYYKERKKPREKDRKLGPKQRLKAEREKLTEEEREKLKEQQLQGKVIINVKKISSDVLEALDEDGFVDISEYSELYEQLIDHDQATYDGDAEEEDSDREFSKLMKFNVNTKFCKPGPKSKKKFLLSDIEDSSDEEKDSSKNNSGDEGKGKKVSRKKKEGLLDIEIEDQDQEEEDMPDEDSFSKKKKKEGGITLNEKLKKNLLLSTDEEEDDDEEEEEEERKDDELAEKERKKHELRKKKKKEEEQNEDDDESGKEESRRVYKKGYVKLDITSDEDDEDFKVDDGDDDDDEDEDEDEDDEDDSDFEESPRKRRTFQISSSDSDDDDKKKKKKRKKPESSDEKSEKDEEEETPKSKRKRIKKVSSSSDEGGEGGDGNNESPSKHKKIRRVIRDEDLMETTKNATQEEEERRKRIAERQKQFNSIFEIDVEADQKDYEKLVLDFDPNSKKELVCVSEKLVKQLKPHQIKGVKFMWDSTIESIEMLKKKAGSGCILAHCMGLGKTLQVITYVHTLLTCKRTNQCVQRVMVCCPVNTVYNWVAEFSNWLKGKMLPFEVSELVSAKDLWGRAYRLDDWWREGGVCVMGYDMFRNLSNPKSKRFKGKMKEIFQKTLVDPGPDVIVCDEGHVLKNEKTALSVAINKIKTLRRIVLTGTPLQNNLKEYHCMIQFVKPNLLGTKKEFMNRFVNPIEQGQCAEADQRDVRRMKRRAHILHNLLEGCVQRFDYTVLKPFLPPKFEYVISVQLSEIQVKLYQYYLDNLAQGGPKRQGSGLFVDYGALSRVWTHPKVLELAVRRALIEEDDDEMDDFICDDSTEESSSEDERAKRKKKAGKKKAKDEDEDDEIEEINEVDKEEAGEPGGTQGGSKKAIDGPIPGLTANGKVRVDWWKKVLEDALGDDYEEDEFLDKMEHSGKLILLMDILRESCSIGDKVLVFSQSLLALDMMEEFLAFVDQGEIELPEPADPLPMPFKKWKKDRDYLRLDGSTSADLRKQMCKSFNSSSNERCRLFLISTRAGGLGINLVAANRVIIFDSSWNPSHDSQSIFRVYRFGQKKPCYVYRFVAQGTMEEKIYSRQVTKMSTALRVVDEHQIKRYFKMADLQQLYEFTPASMEERETPAVPEDRMLAELLKRQKDWIVNYHEQDSLLENQTSEELTEEERKAAWEDYENEKKGLFMQNQRNTVMPVVGAMTMQSQQQGLPSLSLASYSFEGVVNTIKAQNPHLSQNELCESVVLATKQIQRIHLNHYQRVQGMVYNLKNPMIAPEQRKLLPFGNHPEMLPMLEQQLRLLEDNIQRENQVINHMAQITPQRKDNYSSMMSAGLVRGQPTVSDTNVGIAGRSAAVSNSTATTSGSSQQTQNPANPKEDGSGEVIMLD